MTSIRREPGVRSLTPLPSLDWVAELLLESVGPGSVRLLSSDRREALSCACSHQPLEEIFASAVGSGGVEIGPVSSCPALSQGTWNVLAQRGKASQGGSQLLCLATWMEGVGALAVQAEVSHFARRDFRQRRLSSRSMLLALLSLSSILESRCLLAMVKEREEEAHRLAHSSALALEAERERLALQLHDGVVQGLVAVFHLVEALGETAAHQPEQQALAERSEELLRQAIQEARGMIGALHTPIPGQQGLQR